MIELSRYAFEALRKDEEFILYRGQSKDDASQFLVLSPAVQRPLPQSLKRLEHTYSLKEELDPSWAARPIAMARHWDRTVLVLGDPGGVPLDQLLGQPLDVAFSLRLAIGLSTAIGHLHERSIIHKDIKPANVLVNSATGHCWLMGFGIASRLPRERQSPDPPEFVAGTLAYMAPEQTGRMNRSIDSRSDLYALGVTLYEMLTGSLPFMASDPMEWVHCHIARHPVPPAERSKRVPAAVSAIIMKLLAKTAEERYQTAAGAESDFRRCLAEWETQRRVDEFPLGEHDTPYRLLIPEKLYGRAREIDTLLASFERVVAGGTPELVLVSGYSGIGKSSVVNELHKVLVPPRSLFASGKFDQYKREIPYATLAQAFQGLIRPLLAKSEAELRNWRDALHEALGPNGLLVVDLVPELKLIIGEQSPVPELPPQDAKGRFQLVFRRFIGVFARREHPLALFLDDLQWLDAATLELLEHLITEPNVRHVLFIGAYRNNEVGPAHPLARMLNEIRKAGVAVQEIVLTPLSLNDIHQLVVDSLHCGFRRAEPLARLICEKTAGNPFFAIQFLTSLGEQHLLEFDPLGPAWKWNVNQIRAKAFAGNVADLMVGKLQRLPVRTQEVLRQLACLGSSADVATLSIVDGKSEKQIHSDLWKAVRSGLAVRLGASYKFLHDRVQEVAYALIRPELRAQHHLRIGRLLIAKMTSDQITEDIFSIVNQLNLGLALISDPDEKERVAELNLEAGKKAKASIAYASACTYLSAGMDLVGCNAWERRYELVFSLWLERAECEYLGGNFGKAEGFVAELLSRAVSKIDKMAAYRLRIVLQMAQGDYRLAIDSGLECLRLFGIQIPAHPTREQVRIEYEGLWQNLDERSIESLIDLPAMTDPEMQAAMRMLSELSAPAASAFFTDHHLFYLLVYQMANTSMTFGTTDASVHAFADLALILGPVFQRYREGYRFAKLSRRLFDKYGSGEAKALLCMEQVSLWTQPVTTAIEFVRRAFRSCIDAHDLTYACYCCNHLVTDLLLQGVDLEEVWCASQQGLEFVRKVKLHDTADVIVSQQRFILNMRGLTAAFSSFSDGQFDEEKFEARLTEGRMPHLIYYYWILKLQARFISGDFDAAMVAAQKAKPLLWSAEILIESANYYLYSALTTAAVHETAGPRAQSEGPGVLKLSLERLREWSENCPETFLSKHALVSAEVARVEGRDLDAMREYEHAIRAARENGLVQDEALANELAARFYAARGFDTTAQAYLRKARHCYLRWGATGKVRQLDEFYPQLREEEPIPRPTSTIGTPVEHLDLATVIKVSQAVSGEIVLEKLIDMLMRTAIEHAGAERGLLILQRGIEQRIEAEATTAGGTIVVRLGNASLAEAAVPESIVNYAVRTQQSVILDDASTQNPFSADTYIRQQHTRSILCLPLINQGKLIGVLYLENNLTPHVFTPTRIAVLKLLASQAAISLENTRLYRDLEEREARIRRLLDANIVGIFIWNLEGEIIEANEAFLRMVGFSREDLISRRLRWTDLTPADWHDRDEQAIAELAATGIVQPFEKEYFRKDGDRVPVLIGAAFFEGSENEGVAFVLDLSQQKLAEEALQKAQAELAHVTRVTTLGELTASIAHEVNQPLGAVVIHASACLRWLTAQNLEEARRCASLAIANSHRAGEIIRRIRALAKKAPPQKDWLDINEAIDEVIAMARSEVQRNSVLLQTQLGNNLPLILGDRIQLQQVILNLLMNAVEAMSGVDQGPRELRVSSQKSTEITAESEKGTPEDKASANADWTCLLISVRDSGPGLDPKGLDSLFDAFYTTKPQGLGMGLAISRSIVEAHGGRLWAKANAPRGAIFQFTLPILEGRMS